MSKLSSPQVLLNHLSERLRERLQTRCIRQPLMVGIHTGGVWIAEYLHRQLDLQEPLATLDISFYRDDFSRIGMHPQVKPSRVPVQVDDRHIILVDDVLHTGRTIRAAMNELFDYGRPASITLVCLLERNGRELPVCPDIVGERLTLDPRQHVKLTGPEPLAFELKDDTD